MKVRLLDAISSVDAAAWDALAGDDDPFAEHAFLLALERSGTACERTGWAPRHVTVWDGDRLVGALAAYVKIHSYGEFIFDWAWADAAAHLGVRYYPKLVAMTPVTPATGRRLLVADDVDHDAVVRALVDGLFTAAEDEKASSIHVLFLRDAERDALARDGRLAARLSMQFHWENDGYTSYDDYTSRFRSAMRKQVRKEREKANAVGLGLEVVEGPALADSDFAALHRFYLDTCARKGSPPYLTAGFFREVATELRPRVVAAIARKDGEPVAGSLNFEKGRCLFGRYWGALDAYDSLHFELCFHRLIERAIARGHQRFEAGAQGMHKLRRGLMPARIHSMHWVREPRLRDAVLEFLPREARAVERQIRELADHGPFRRGEP